MVTLRVTIKGKALACKLEALDHACAKHKIITPWVVMFSQRETIMVSQRETIKGFALA
jgi:hypothetical protein